MDNLVDAITKAKNRTPLMLDMAKATAQDASGNETIDAVQYHRSWLNQLRNAPHGYPVTYVMPDGTKWEGQVNRNRLSTSGIPDVERRADPQQEPQ